MGATLDALMISGGDSIYHSPEFVTYVHTHKRYLMETSVRAPVDPGLVHKYEFNFTSLLVEMGYSLEDLIFFMVANDMHCPTQMTRDFRELVIPNQGLVENLKMLFGQSYGRV